MKKILFMTNILSFYRVDFFNELGKYCELTVTYEQDKVKDRNDKFYKTNNDNFKLIRLNKNYCKLRKIMREDYDYVIVGTYATFTSAMAIYYMKRKKINFFINADGGFIQENEPSWSKKLKTTFISKANYYLSTGKETNKYLTYYGANPSNIYIYPFTSLYNDDILYKPLNYDEKMKLRMNNNYNYKRLFISVGSFIHRKGYDIFFEAIKQFKNDEVGFLIIGGGELKEQYIKFINDHEIKNVHLIDFCEKKEILNYYKMSDVFYFPSREDIWGLVVNEAMSCGLPIISSKNVLSSRELLPDDCLYDYNNIEKLRELIINYTNKTEKELFIEGIRNIEKIKQYTIENMAKKHIEIFEKLG